MKTEAAVLWEIGAQWKIETIDLDPPKHGEVLVRLVASGMCHSDEHLVTGDLPMQPPVIGGHEGAGVVEAVGPGVTRLQVGDHVLSSFVPMCGRCAACMAGQSNLCEHGSGALGGGQLDGTYRHHIDGRDIESFCRLGTFARHTVGSELSWVKIDDDLPLDKACLVSCGVTTGWASAVNRAEVRAGDDVVVIGAGGVGSAAIQGARLAGARTIVAVDPVEFKREQAKQFGATHVAASIDEALPLIVEITHGRLAHKAICTMGVGDGQLLASITALVGKRGRVVITNIHPFAEDDVKLSMREVVVYEKEIVGSLFGSASPHREIPRLLTLYRNGQIDLDGMVTRTYPLEGINDGYQDMRDGKNIRGVIVLD
ncbi:MAG: NDMA-dependent alcohol dehydrogenase [Acidobacteria bacterium]|nr:NDMA-dependent alcohol dehydrogenase [Acidobacteriota bacterium]